MRPLVVLVLLAQAFGAYVATMFIWASTGFRPLWAGASDGLYYRRLALMSVPGVLEVAAIVVATYLLAKNRTRLALGTALFPSVIVALYICRVALIG